MPHRVGHLKEQVLTEQNCIKAVIIGTANLEKTPKIVEIASHPEKYGKQILQILREGWVPASVRHKIINEGTNKKTRELTIPTTMDHLIHVAIMLPLIPILLQRYDDYSCGSIPNKGSAFAQKCMKSWIQGDYPYEYAAECDVHKFYASCKQKYVMKCLRHIIKDEEYLLWHEMILTQMGGVIAIGFTPSHWYGNLVLTFVDNAIRAHCPKIKFVRYMDNYVLVSHDKTILHHAIQVIFSALQTFNLTLNDDWQIFPVTARGVKLLSYRYFPNKTILKKETMYVITARLKTAGRNNCAHLARGAMSRFGIIKHCNSYNYYNNYLAPNIKIFHQRRMISNVDKKCTL